MQNAAAAGIQATVRMTRQVKWFKATRKLAIALQAVWRGRVARAEASDMLQSAVTRSKLAAIQANAAVRAVVDALHCTH